jgi:Mg2+ and Co2+ transporter CorA
MGEREITKRALPEHSKSMLESISSMSASILALTHSVKELQDVIQRREEGTKKSSQLIEQTVPDLFQKLNEFVVRMSSNSKNTRTRRSKSKSDEDLDILMETETEKEGPRTRSSNKNQK